MTPNVKLQDLPIELQSHILLNLSPLYASYEVPFATDEILTDDLLHAAQSSDTLRKAVVYGFGSSAKFLSFYHSLRIWEWIPLFQKQVKSFSFSGVQHVPYMIFEEDSVPQVDNISETILETLKALYCNCVALEELDLERLKMINVEREEELAEHVNKAIQRSGLSLRRITLTINKATAMALRNVTLPNLEVANLCFDSDYIDIESVYPSPARNLGDILKGINGSAARQENNIALREICIRNLHGPPIIDRESCATIFSVVEKLTIKSAKTSARINSEIMDFISLFRNLKTLCFYTNSTCAEDMHKVTRGCSNLEELELHVRDRRFLSGSPDLAENPSGMKELFESFQGKLRNLKTAACFPRECVKILGENSPNLQILEMEIDSDNVSGLTSLLGTHCRKLRELRLQYSNTAMASLGRDGWPALAQAICSASDELRVIKVYGDWLQPFLEPATTAMVDSIIEIIQSTGHHASLISFHAPMDTHNPFIVLDALWRILNVAKNYSTSIKFLKLKFIRMLAFGEYWVDNAELDDLLRFSAQLSDFRDKFFSSQYQTKIDFGDLNNLSEYQLSQERNNDNG